MSDYNLDFIPPIFLLSSLWINSSPRNGSALKLRPWRLAVLEFPKLVSLLVMYGNNIEFMIFPLELFDDFLLIYSSRAFYVPGLGSIQSTSVADNLTVDCIVGLPGNHSY